MKLRVHPLFLLSLFLYMLVGGIGGYLQAFSAVFCHELGHLLIARIAGAGDMTICLMPCGATLRIEGEATHHGAILLAGPIVNLILASTSLAVSWLFPEMYGYLKGFVRANLVLAVVNLLPAYPLDGGRVLRLFFRGKWARIFTEFFPILPAALSLFLFSKGGNLSYLLFAFFMLAYCLDSALRRVNRCKETAPLYTLFRTSEEGRILPARVKRSSGEVCRLSPYRVTELCLKYPRESRIGAVLDQEKSTKSGYK